MTKNLRKRHLQIWSLLLVLLPAGIIAARLVTPVPVTDKLLQPRAAAALPVIVKTIEKENYAIHIRKSNDSTFQLEWINKTTLTVPTATIYKIAAGSTDIKKGILIGRIEARGTHLFPLTDKGLNISANQRFQLLLYDFIHQQVIDTINFTQ